MDIYVFITAFFVVLSILKIAIAGTDHFQRIKHSENLKLYEQKSLY